MNKKIKILVAALLIVSSFGLVACTNKDNKTPSDGSQVEDSDKKEPINDGKDDEVDKENDNDKNEESSDKNDDKTDGSTSSSQGNNTSSGNNNSGNGVVTPSDKQEVIYKAFTMDSDLNKLESREVKTTKGALKDFNAPLKNIKEGLGIDKNTKVLSFERTGYNTGILNLSKDIYTNKVGSSIGGLRLEGIAKTYMSAYGVDAVVVRVDGNGYSDGHIQYGKFDPVKFSSHTNPPVVDNTKEVVFNSYTMDKTVSFLEKKQIKTTKDKLKDYNVPLNEIKKGLSIDSNTKVLSFERTGYNTGILNLTKDIYTTKVGSGVGVLRLQGIAKTYMSAYGVDAIIVRVEGAGYSDGHVDLGKFDTVSIN
ncbi:MAG: hypothetical protein ACRC41_01390 [Sarcina sp.]